MTHSPETQARFDHAVGTIDSYQYQGDALTDKILVPIIAPSGVGKSALIQAILEVATHEGIDAGEVATWTTRPGRADDPDTYKTDIAIETMLDLIEAKQLVNWAPHPSGAIYASGPESYPAEYNFLPMLPEALPLFRRAGFRAIRAYYLTAPVEAWQQHLAERQGHQFASRLREAQTSLAWATSHQHEVTILHNHEGAVHLARLARTVLDDVRGIQAAISDKDAGSHLHNMQAYISHVTE